MEKGFFPFSPSASRARSSPRSERARLPKRDMTMTDRTEEFQGAVSAFRPTVAVVNNSGEAAAIRAQTDLGYRKTSEFLQLAESVAVGFEGTSRLVGVFLPARSYRAWVVGTSC